MERNVDGSGGRGSRQHAARLAVVAIVGLLSAAFLLLSTRAEAKQQFMSLFGQAYPAAAGSPLDSCLLCHTNPSGPDEDNLNRYGLDWEDGDIGDKRFLAGALVRRDSDGDGVPNGQEIEQGSFPGNPSSNTPPTTTTTIPGAPIDGQALFASRCAACHGPNGGNLSSTTLGRSTFITITRDGRGTMPAQSGLTAAEVGAIWDYVTGAAPVVTTTTTIPGGTTTTTTPASGAAVWANNCAACHGAAGGNVVPTTLGNAQLTAIITNGIGSMRGFPELGAAQISNVANYLSGFGTTTTTTIPGATTTTTTPASGAAVWADNCAVCHGAAGGNLRGRSLDLTGIASATAGGVGTMPGFASRLSAAEIANVSAYVYGIAGGQTAATTTTSIPPGTPQSGADLYLQACSACHGVHGEGGAGGPVAGTSLSRMQTIGLIANGSDAMPGYGSVLSMEEIEAVADHVLGIAAPSGEIMPPEEGVIVPPPPPPTTATPSAPDDGHPDLVASGPAARLGPLPGDSGGGRWMAALLVGSLGLGALVLWGRSLRNLTGWSKSE